MVSLDRAGRLELARAVAQHLAGQSGVETVVLAGSLAVGLGSSTSDIDIYLIGPDLVDTREQIAWPR
jgi:predicted nucleotidyltransferase